MMSPRRRLRTCYILVLAFPLLWCIQLALPLISLRCNIAWANALGSACRKLSASRFAHGHADSTIRRGLANSEAAADLELVGVPAEYASDAVYLSSRLADLQDDNLTHPLMLARFLSFAEVKDAESLIRDAHYWRINVDVPAIMSEWGVPDKTQVGWRRSPQSPRAILTDRHFCAGRVSAQTRTGAPLLVAKLGQLDMDGVVREGMVDLVFNQFVFLTEDILQAQHAISVRKQELVLATLVIDVNGLGLGVLKHASALKRFANVFNSYYPELADTIVIVNAPFFFVQIWRIFSLMLAPSTNKKVQIYGKNFAADLEAKTAVDLDSLPAWLGGQGSDFDVPPSEQVPQGAMAELQLEAVR